MLVQVAQEAGDGWTRTRSVTAQHTRIGTPQGNPSLEAAFGREDPGSGFFQRCLAKSRGSTPEERRNWRDGIFEQIREVMLLQSSLSIERMCQLVPVSRRSFYRSLKEQRPAEEVTEVRSAIQQIALEHRRRYGYRQTATVQRFSSVMAIKATVKIGPEIDAKLYKEFATVVGKKRPVSAASLGEGDRALQRPPLAPARNHLELAVSLPQHQGCCGNSELFQPPPSA